MHKITISTFAYEILREHEYEDQRDQYERLIEMLSTYSQRAGTDHATDTHWAEIEDEDLLIARLKYEEVFKYLTVRRIP